MRKGFFEGVGWPLGRREGEGEDRPWKEAKAEGVREVASAGGGLPVILAKSVRIQRRMVNIPRMEPSVVRRLENCSATDTIAVVPTIVSITDDFLFGERFSRTEKTRMGSHVGAFQHLREASERTDQAFDNLKRSLRALAEAVRQAIWIIGIRAHHAWLTHAAVHASHASHAAHAAHAAVH